MMRISHKMLLPGSLKISIGVIYVLITTLSRFTRRVFPIKEPSIRKKLVWQKLAHIVNNAPPDQSPFKAFDHDEPFMANQIPHIFEKPHKVPVSLSLCFFSKWVFIFRKSFLNFFLQRGHFEPSSATISRPSFSMTTPVSTTSAKK